MGKGSRYSSIELTFWSEVLVHQSVIEIVLSKTSMYTELSEGDCNKVMSYAERVAKRKAEIEGLKEALEILSA